MNSESQEAVRIFLGRFSAEYLAQTGVLRRDSRFGYLLQGGGGQDPR